MTKFDYSVDEPLNREPAVDKLVSSFITTADNYDRNHGPIPHLDGATFTVSVDGAVKTPLELSMKALREDYAQHSVTCALQCAGNRRHTMRTLLKEVSGINWKDGAVMNCEWTGPRLKDVLLKAGVTHDDALHVAFASHQANCQDDKWYGGSISLINALDEDREVILALKMNGEELPVNHGYPVRVIVPGVAGARSVKWLDRITVQTNESTNFYQYHDYKILPPEATDMKKAEEFWGQVPALQDMPVNSSVAVPQNGEEVKLQSNGTVEAKGYALPRGADGPVVKVEVSADDGRTWSEAEIQTGGKWAWALWRAAVKMERGNGRILSRATDRAGNTQQGSPVWNLRGVGYDGYGEARDLTIV